MSIDGQSTGSTTSEFKPNVKVFVEELMNDFMPTPLQTYEQYYQRMKSKVEKQFKDEFESIRDGYNLISEYNLPLSERLEISAEAISKLSSKETYQNAESEFNLQHILNWATEDILELEKLAIKLYDDNKFDQSLLIYGLLCFVCPNIVYFWKGKGDVAMALNKDSEAFNDYVTALYVDPYDISTYINFCNFLCIKGEQELAIKLIENGLQLVESDLEENVDREVLEKFKSHLNELYKIIDSFK